MSTKFVALWVGSSGMGCALPLVPATFVVGVAGAAGFVDWPLVGEQPGDETSPLQVGASIKAEAGLPPNVSASSAFSAYGTLTSNTRPPCADSGRLPTPTPSQRASHEVNSPTATPP